MTRELAAIAISRFVEIGMREMQLFAFFSCIVVLDEWLAGNDRLVPSNKRHDYSQVSIMMHDRYLF